MSVDVERLRTRANAHPNTDGTPWGWVEDSRGREVPGLRWSGQSERDLADRFLDRLAQAEAERKGLDVERVHRITCKALIEHEAGTTTPYVWPCAAFAREYAALATTRSA